MATIRELQAKFTANTQGLSSTIGNVTSQLRGLQKESDRTSKKMSGTFDSQGRSVEKFRSQLFNLEKRYDSQSKSVTNARSEYDKMAETYGENSDEAKKAANNLDVQIASQKSLASEIGNTRDAFKEFNKQQDIQSAFTTKLSDGFNNVGNVLDTVSSKARDVGGTLTKYVTAPVAGLATLLGGTAISKGFSRLLDIDTAKAKLKGLGHDAKNVETIMNSATDSVKGTAFGLGEAATTAANAVAAGVEPGKELTRYLTLTGDAAAIAGTDMSEMGSIFNKVQTNNKIQAEEMNQLMDRGIPIVKLLAEQMNVAESEVKNMAAAGEISAEDFLSAIDKGFGGAAKIMGETSFQAALDNMWASVGRIGANFLDAGGEGGGFFSQMKPLMGELTDIFSSMEEGAAQWGVKFGEAFANLVQWIRDFIAKIKDLDDWQKKLLGWGAAFAVALGPVLVALGTFGGFVGSVASGIGGLLGAFSKFGVSTGLLTKTLDDGTKKVGLLTRVFKPLLSIVTRFAGPVGIAIGVITALGAAFMVAYKKSETFRNFVDNLKSKFADASSGIMIFKDKVVAVFNALVAFFKGDWSTGINILQGLGFSEEQILWIQNFVLSIKRNFHIMKEAVGDALSSISTFFGEMIGKLNAFWKSDGEQLASAIVNAFNIIKGVISVVLNVIFNIVKSILPQVIEQFRITFNMVKTVVTTVWNVIKAVIKNGLDVILGLVKIFTGIFTGDWKKVFEGVLQIFKGAIGLFVDVTRALMQGIINIVISLGQSLLNRFKTLVSFIGGIFNGLFSSVSGIWNSIKDSVVKIVTDLALVAVMKFHQFRGNLLKIFFTIRYKIAEIWNGIKTTIVGFATQIWSSISNTFNSIRNTVVNIWTSIRNKITELALSIYTYVTTRFSGLFTFVSNIFTTLKNVVTAIWNGIKYAIEFAVRLIYTVVKWYFTNLFNGIKTIFTAVKNFLSTVWDFIYSKIKTVATAIWNAVSSIFTSLKNTVTNIFNAVRNVVVTIWNFIYSKIKTVATSIWNTVKSIFTSLWNTVTTIFNNIRDRAVAIWTNIYDRLKQIVLNLWTNITTRVTNLKNRVVTLFNQLRESVVNRVSRMYNSVTGYFKNLWTNLTDRVLNIKNNIANRFNEMKEAVTGTASDLWTSVKETFNNMKSGLDEIIDKIKEKIGGMTHKVKEGINSLIDGINWVADKIGMDALPKIELSTGTQKINRQVSTTYDGRLKEGTFATVGDRGPGNGPGGYRRELIQYPNGQTALTPAKDTFTYLPRGSRVINGRDTHTLLNTPRYSRGTGLGESIMSGASKMWEGAKDGANKAYNSAKNAGKKAVDLAGDIWEYASNPGKLVDLALDKFGFNFDFAEGSLIKDLLQVAYKKLKEGVKELFTGWLEMGGSGGDGSSFMKFPKTTPYSPNAPVPGYPRSFNNGHHYGEDYATPVGTILTAPTAGTVSSINDHGGGLVARLVSGQFTQFFMHLQDILKTGPVKQGDQFAKTGNSGAWTTAPHLHYQVERGLSKYVTNKNTIAPQDFLRGVTGHAGAVKGSWTPQVISALKQNGLPTSKAYVDAWNRQIQSESSGNPNAIQQIRDINSGGNEARGLVQVIPPTFNAYKLPGMNNIMNPLHNLAAGMNYAKNRYGKSGLLNVIGKGHGYAIGGITDGMPELAWLNEEGFRESIISHNPAHKDRSFDIWHKTGDMLGFNDRKEELSLLREEVGLLKAIVRNTGNTADNTEELKHKESKIVIDEYEKKRRKRQDDTTIIV